MSRALVFAVAYFLLGLVLVLGGDLEVFDQADEARFHLPTIERYAAELPAPNLREHGAAMGPLYHLALAVPARLGAGLGALRVLTLMVATAGVLMAFRATEGSRVGAAAAAAMALSPYYVGAAVRLSTDDVALAFVVGALVALDRGRFVLACALGVLAVWTRQIHVWLAVPLLARAWGDPRRMIAALAPVGAVVVLFAIWGGLVPPAFQKGHLGAILNLDVLVVVLAAAGLYALFFAPSLVRAVQDLRPRWIDLGIAALGGAALLAVHPVAYSVNPRRWGGSVLSVAGPFPDVGGTDLLLWALVPLGAIAVVVAIRSAGLQGRTAWAFALPAFVVCNLASDRAYQKYYEPFLVLALGAALGRRDEPLRAWWGPAALAAGFLAIDLWRFQ
jgi:hypothetical protein